MRKVYDKLVRDRIPDIIRQSGSECATETFSPDEFRRALRDKLVEEAREAANASDDDLLTELADVEVVVLVAPVCGVVVEHRRPQPQVG